ncbi:carbohydrate kinase family protein [Pseudonocardia sp. HH130630-07]|uniref:carbohydrate kinase family protein n=1 Tax=Pseudonocardia sp. HH130630-07 TaxID=1690815 RepID=UPI0008151F79|nr:carbohydrate kinase family protein [Pseudonocardia sp. HH130630-07]ANY09296.1 carbohydrate kinase [Pseudonocardia sp. HH130630-07]
MTDRSHRTVAVLGPIPRDHVTTHRGEVFDSYGCVTYTTAALAALLGPDDRVVPVVHVRREDQQVIEDLLGELGNVDLSLVRSHADRGDVIDLTYLDQNRREELQAGFMPPITAEDVAPVIGADAFVCVPITDYEVPVATLAHLRQHGTGTILLDGHGPTVSVAPGGRRTRRLWIDRDQWLPHVDILKMNLEEAGRSWFPSPGGDPAAVGAPLPRAELPRFAEHCIDRGVRAVCVTLDEDGCALYERGPDGAVREHLVPRIEVPDVVDTTGCGDSFAAGLAYGHLQFADFVAAARYGNAMGAQRASGPGLDVYLDLERTARQVRSAYGPAVVR